jgi:nucleolar protein 12
VENSKVADKIEDDKPTKEAKHEDADEDKDLTAFQLKERKQRTVFVGNIPLDASQKKVKKFFMQCGKVEKVWFRSVPVAEDSKKPQKAKIIAGEYGMTKDSKNAYVLFTSKDDALKAKHELNQKLFIEKHIRVDTCGEGMLTEEEKKLRGRNQSANEWEDFTRTIFIGNLPFIVSEEELRSSFAECGTIENIRLIRDPKTHMGKGIGYIMFSTKEEMIKTLDEKKEMKFKGRPLRIQRAVAPKRREKKQQKKEA